MAYKTCPKCQKKNGVRTLSCECGHEFIKSKSKVTQQKQVNKVIRRAISKINETKECPNCYHAISVRKYICENCKYNFHDYDCNRARKKLDFNYNVFKIDGQDRTWWLTGDKQYAIVYRDDLYGIEPTYFAMRYVSGIYDKLNNNVLRYDSYQNALRACEEDAAR